MTEPVINKSDESPWVKVKKVAQMEIGDIWDVRSDPAYGPAIQTRFVYTRPEGHYVGDVKTARRLAAKGIKPELRSPENKVCTIGFSEREQKWYGWSHRAIYGFGVGSVVKAGDCADESLPVGFTAKTLDDAKRIAVAFAQSVA